MSNVYSPGIKAVHKLLSRYGELLLGGNKRRLVPYNKIVSDIRAGITREGLAQLYPETLGRYSGSYSFKDRLLNRLVYRAARPLAYAVATSRKLVGPQFFNSELGMRPGEIRRLTVSGNELLKSLIARSGTGVAAYAGANGIANKINKPSTIDTAVPEHVSYKDKLTAMFNSITPA